MRSLTVHDRERVILYVHPRFDEASAAAAWKNQDLGEPRTVRFDGSWDNFHRLFGNHHAGRVFMDQPP